MPSAGLGLEDGPGIGPGEDSRVAEPSFRPLEDEPSVEPADDEPVVISSLVVECDPARVDDVALALSAMDCVEVHEKQGYKLVVSIEAPSVDRSHALASSFIGIPGVMGVNLIYCNFEDEWRR